MKKHDKIPKIKRIELRVTDEFFQDLNSKIEDSGLSKADYFRHILSQGKVVVKKDYNTLCTQIRKCGVNLNEIAFVLNIAANEKRDNIVQAIEDELSQTQELENQDEKIVPLRRGR